MQYLDFDKFSAIDAADFRATHPYPWINPQGLLTDTGYQRLLDNMPDIALFEKKFGYGRIAGQKPHDRYSLEYAPGTPVPEPWQEFIAELCSDDYRKTLAKLFGARKINLRFHWHYTPNGCSVSPHTDSVREHGSQLFYFNPEGDWDPAWGGDTLVLDDGGQLKFETAPTLDDFSSEVSASSIGNYSLIFERTRHSWHAVREISCPEDRLRRVFIVVANPENMYRTVRDKIMRKNVHRF
ncbi:MAG: hypothetical protein GWP20_00335 [Thermotogales bacterium]|nr:hypothetical protein [Thermotogales bacterium]